MSEAVTQSTTDKAAPFLSAKARRRQWWLKIHRWTGLTLLLPLAILGLTGSALVWPSTTMELVYPERASTDRSADPADLRADHIQTAREALADFGPISAIRFGEVGDPLLIGTEPHAPPNFGIGPPTRMAAYVDPASGTLLSATESTGDFMWYMHAAHGHLLLKNVGRPVVGVMGLFLLLSAITGIVIWWPGRKRILSSLKWQKRDGKMLNLHRQSGVLLSLVLIAETFTGVWISFPTFFGALVEPAAQHEGMREAEPPRGAPASLLAQEDEAWVSALATAQQAYPGRPASMIAPNDQSRTWEVAIAGEQGPAAVTVSASTGETQIQLRRAQASRADLVEHAMDGIHAAHIGGPLWQWLTFLSGLVLAFLSCGGLYIWAKRKLRGN